MEENNDVFKSPYYILDEKKRVKQCNPDEWRDYFKLNKRYTEFNKIIVKKNAKESQLIIESEMVVKEPSILIYTIFTGIENGFNKNKKPFVYETHVFNFTNNDKYNFFNSFVFRDINQSSANKTNNRIVKTLLHLLRNKGLLSKNDFLKEMDTSKVFPVNKN